MGMGEPMHNLPAVIPSIETLCQPLGMHLSANKVRIARRHNPVGGGMSASHPRGSSFRPSIRPPVCLASQA